MCNAQNMKDRTGLGRRAFLKAGAAAFAAGCVSVGRAESSADYSVVMLGDVHFDSPDPDKYHRMYKPEETYLKRAFAGAHARTRQMWPGLMDRLAAAARQDQRSDTKFVLQLGDLIQGNCGTEPYQRAMLADAFEYFKNHAAGDLPFVPVVGNHDEHAHAWVDSTTTPPEIYRRVIVPRVARELNQPLEGPTFSFRQGRDLFVYLDYFHEPDLALILRLLDDARDVRHTFVVTHGPIIPSNPATAPGRYRDGLFAKVEQTEQRRALVKALCRRNAIVLAGHCHRTELEEIVTPDGCVTQFMGSSVWATEKTANAVPHRTEVAQYGVIPKKFQKGYDPVDAEALFAEFRSFVTRYVSSGLQGRFLLEVRGDAVSVSLRGGDSPEELRRYSLRG